MRRGSDHGAQGDRTRAAAVISAARGDGGVRGGVSRAGSVSCGDVDAAREL